MRKDQNFKPVEFDGLRKLRCLRAGDKLSPTEIEVVTNRNRLKLAEGFCQMKQAQQKEQEEFSKRWGEEGNDK